MYTLFLLSIGTHACYHRNILENEVKSQFCLREYNVNQNRFGMKKNNLTELQIGEIWCFTDPCVWRYTVAAG